MRKWWSKAGCFVIRTQQLHLFLGFVYHIQKLLDKPFFKNVSTQFELIVQLKEKQKEKEIETGLWDVPKSAQTEKYSKKNR